MKMNFKSKKTIKKTTALIILAVAMLVVGVVGFLSNGFTNGDVNSWVKERNPDNLLDYTMPVENLIRADGTIVNIAKDGTILVTGEIAEDSETWTYELGDVILPAGTYNLTCSNKCNKNNYIIKGTYTDGTTKTIYSDISDENTFTLTKETVVTFSFEIYKEGNINIEARPVLAQGLKPIDFYVKKTIGN